MSWFRNLFGKPRNEDTGPSEITIRTAEIQARIAAFKSSYPWSEEPTKTIKEQPKIVVIEEKSLVKSKSQEMDALKAKLLGKK